MIVYVLTEKTCKRCHGKGWANWGSLYGPCYRCGGETGKESVVDVEATLKSFEDTLSNLKVEAAVHQSVLDLGVGDTLTQGNARRELEHCRKVYRWTLDERRDFFSKQAAKKGKGKTMPQPKEIIDLNISRFPETFSLRGFPKETFRIAPWPASSVWNEGREDESVQLVTQRLIPNGNWLDFVRCTPSELRQEIVGYVAPRPKGWLV